MTISQCGLSFPFRSNPIRAGHMQMASLCLVAYEATRTLYGEQVISASHSCKVSYGRCSSVMYTHYDADD